MDNVRLEYVYRNEYTISAYVNVCIWEFQKNFHSLYEYICIYICIWPVLSSFSLTGDGLTNIELL